MIFSLDTSNDNVINICKDISSKLVFYDLRGHTVKAPPSIFEPLKHANVAIRSEGGCETCFGLVLFVKPDLVVS